MAPWKVIGILGGRGSQKTNIFKGKYAVNLKFLAGERHPKQKSSVGGVWIFFWNNTLGAYQTECIILLYLSFFEKVCDMAWLFLFYLNNSSESLLLQHEYTFSAQKIQFWEKNVKIWHSMLKALQLMKNKI